MTLSSVSDLGGGRYRLDMTSPLTTWKTGRYLLSVAADLRPAFQASGRTVVSIDVP